MAPTSCAGPPRATCITAAAAPPPSTMAWRVWRRRRPYLESGTLWHGVGHVQSGSLSACAMVAGLRRSEARTVAQSRVFARADEAARAHSSLACCHLSARIFIRFKEPELFYFYPPAAPKNFIKRLMMRPSRPTRVNSLREDPPTRRDLASDTLPPHFRSRSTSCFSPLSVPRCSIFP